MVNMETYTSLLYRQNTKDALYGIVANYNKSGGQPPFSILYRQTESAESLHEGDNPPEPLVLDVSKGILTDKRKLYKGKVGIL